MQINRQTYEEFFLLYADGELNETERREVEDFIDRNPDLKGELNLIREAIMVPDESIVFDNKEILFRKEDNRRVVMMRWSRYAAAAVVLLGLTVAGWLFLNEQKKEVPVVAVIQPGQQGDKPSVKENNTIDAPSTTSEKNIDVLADAAANNSSGIAPRQSSSSSDKKITNKISVTTGEPLPENKTVIEPQEVITTQPVEEPAVTLTTPDPAEITNDVVFTEPSTDPIDVEVSPREMCGQDEQADTDIQYTQAVNKDREKSDMIYFANTSLTKKTKLRGVLRKAGRYLERVTSIQ